MLNKSKLDFARLKITKLKEKYFNTEINPEKIKPPSVHSSISSSEISTNKGKSSYKKIVDDIIEHPGTSRYSSTKKEDNIEQLLLTPSPHLNDTNLFSIGNQTVPNAGHASNPLDTVNLKASPASPDSPPSVRNSKSDRFDPNNEQYSSKVSLSESTILSELSNKFENIHFLSSSSNDLSLDQDNSLIYIKEISKGLNNITKTANKVLIHSPKIGTIDVSSNIWYKKDSELSNQSTLVTHSKISSMSSVHSVEELAIFSRESGSLAEYNTDFESDHSNPKESPSNGNVFNERTDKESLFTLDNSRELGIERGLLAQCTQVLENKLVDSDVITLESSFISKARTPKRKSSNEKNILNEISPHLSLQERIQEPVSTPDSTAIKSKQFRKSVKHEKMSQKLKSKQKSTQTDLFQISPKEHFNKLKPKKHGKNNHPIHRISLSPSKRPILKSCRPTSITNSRTNTAENVNSLMASFLINESVSTFKNSGVSLDEFMRQVLTNQVQLTQHFLDSHHQMYLHCCQAAKTLSQEYSKSHKKVCK